MKQLRKMIEIDEALCNGCGECVPSCEEGAIQIIAGKARVIAEKYCDGLGACLGHCPTGALKIIEREADAFDEEAVKVHLKSLKAARAQAAPSTPCGCPSAQMKTFAPTNGKEQKAESTEAAQSELRQWPVQIGLVPSFAPFLKDAHLLVAADCVPVAYPRFHQDFLKDKVVLVGCPKFDNLEAYQQRFAEIFTNNEIASVTAVVMEVPCCQGLPVAIQNGINISCKQVPLEKVVISLQGEVLSREKIAV